MSQMFSGCSGVTILDLSGFKTAVDPSVDEMFSGCTAVKIIDFGQYKANTIPDTMFSNFTSDVPFIIIAPSQGIQNYDFSTVRPLSMMELTTIKGSFPNQSKDETARLNHYVYESREALADGISNAQDEHRPFYPTYYLLRWDPNGLSSDYPVEELWNRANGSYTAVWWPADVKLRSRFFR